MESVLLEKVPFMALYSRKIRVWGGSQTMWNSFQTKFKCKKHSLHSFWNPSMRTHAHVCDEVYIRRAWACVCMHMYTHARPRVSVAFLFQK